MSVDDTVEFEWSTPGTRMAVNESAIAELAATGHCAYAITHEERFAEAWLRDEAWTDRETIARTITNWILTPLLVETFEALAHVPDSDQLRVVMAEAARPRLGEILRERGLELRGFRIDTLSTRSA